MRRMNAAAILPMMLLTAALVGCEGGKKIPIISFPSFYTPALKRVAILPFKNYTRDPSAGQVVTEKLASFLTANGTYEVYTRSYLREVLGEQDLSATDMIDPATAVRMGGLAGVQAIIVGGVTRYEGHTSRETRYMQVPTYAYDARGRMYISGWRNVPYVWIRHEATTEANAKIISTATGKELGAFSEAFTAYSEGRSPQYPPSVLITQSAQVVGYRLLADLAVTRQEIKPPKDALRIAENYFDGKWDYLDKVRPNQEFFVVVRLTNQCDRNRFGVAIAREGEDVRQNVWETELVWKAGMGHWFTKLKAADIVSKAGQGRFVLKLYSGPSPVLTQKFAIEP